MIYNKFNFDDGSNHVNESFYGGAECLVPTLIEPRLFRDERGYFFESFNMKEFTFTKKLSVKKEYDVIVVGGGVAGCAAAVSVAKRGKSVLLIEKTNLLGGLGTIGLINFFVPMCNGRGKQIIFGLAEKWLRQSAELSYDTIPSDWEKGEPLNPTEQRYVQRYSPNIFALQLLEEVKKYKKRWS